MQFLPPKAGDGLVQLRVLLCSPPPQDFVQGPHSLQSLQLPSTVKETLSCYDSMCIGSVTTRIVRESSFALD